jgi:hypothetical protein
MHGHIAYFHKLLIPNHSLNDFLWLDIWHFCDKSSFHTQRSLINKTTPHNKSNATRHFTTSRKKHVDNHCCKYDANFRIAFSLWRNPEQCPYFVCLKDGIHLIHDDDHDHGMNDTHGWRQLLIKKCTDNWWELHIIYHP